MKWSLKENIQRIPPERRDTDAGQCLEPTWRMQSSRVSFHLGMHRICCQCHENQVVPETHDNKHGCQQKVNLKVKVRTFDIAPLSETPPQKRSSMARVLKRSHSFTCMPTRASAIGMSHTRLCLPGYSWYSFTIPGGMEGWVGPGDWLCSDTVYLPKGSHPSHY